MKRTRGAHLSSVLTSRERIHQTLAHLQPDRVPIDLGSTAVTGMHVSAVYALRQALQLDQPLTPVRVIDPYQMLGEIGTDLLDWLGVDAVGLAPLTNFFGFQNEGWKPWEMPDGTPVLVPALFNTEPAPDGSFLQYPQGDRSAAPCARMPAGGFYFDAIIRQPPLDSATLDPEDNMEEFVPLAKDELSHLALEAERLYTQTGRALVLSVEGTAFGDVSMVPAPWLKNPRGIRDVEEWYVSTVKRSDYVHQVFERQCQVGLANLQRIYEAVGNRVSVAFVTGTDFGTQNGPFLSVKLYRELYFPYHRRICNWIHEHTGWKTFLHSCGSILPLVPGFIEAGFDILNPVQWTAAGMDMNELKERFGRRLVFWGGGVDTQRTLPFGTPEEVRAQVRQCVRTLGAGGGLVLNPVHNVQPGVSVENLLALFRAFREPL
jgi:hypothetical protein